MDRWTSLRVGATPGLSSRSGFARAGHLVATLATGAAVLLAAVLTLVFAATVAVAAVLATALFALYAIAMRSRRSPRQGPVLIEARRVGHSWVAYGWDQRSR